MSMTRLSDNFPIRDFRKYIEHQLLGTQLTEYYKTKHNWDDGTYNTVHWECLGTTIQRKSPIQRYSVIKLLHKWKNVGNQNIKFYNTEEEYKTISMSRRELTFKSPYKCGENETHLHFIYCRYNIEKSLEKKTLRTAIMHAIHTYHDHPDSPIVYEPSPSINQEEILVVQAYNEQAKIVWDNIHRGLVSKTWIEVEGTYHDQHPSPDEAPPSTRDLGSKLCSLRMEYTLTL